MIILPEIFELVVKYTNSNDTINMSMVCSSWRIMMINMFDTNTHYKTFEIIKNDSFALSQYLLKFDADKTLKMIDISSINNNNCLNCVTYNMAVIKDCDLVAILQELLTQYCILDNASKLLYIDLLLHDLLLCSNQKHVLDNMLNICLHNGSYQVATYLSLKGATCSKWLSTIPYECVNKESCNKIIIVLEYLLNIHFIDLPMCLKYITIWPEFNHKEDIINFIIPYLSHEIIKMWNN